MTTQLSDDDKYKALLEKDAQYDGAFYVGITTTGIFCRTICRARKPKRENVKFYDSIQEAMSAGFRPCKICRPMESAGTIPEEIAKLIHEVEENPNFKIKEWQLKERGIDPSTLRRYFNKNYGMSFQAFCRMNRISSAFGAVKEGEKVVDAAASSGYDSLSGFNAAFEKILGDSPSRVKNAVNVLLYKRFDSPLGPMVTVVSDKGVCLVEFGDRRMLETEFKDLEKRFKAVILPGRNNHTDQVISELNEYFEGSLKNFTVNLDTAGTDFQKVVWNALIGIGYGEICSYKDLAITIEKPSAVRAVGHANGFNKIAIIIPCHRVIGSDGALTGYGGGLWRKEWLLNHEAKFKGGINETD